MCDNPQFSYSYSRQLWTKTAHFSSFAPTYCCGFCIFVDTYLFYVFSEYEPHKCRCSAQLIDVRFILLRSTVLFKDKIRSVYGATASGRTLLRPRKKTSRKLISRLVLTECRTAFFFRVLVQMTGTHEDRK